MLNYIFYFPIFESMKSIVFLYAAFTSLHPFEKKFGNQSAFERALIWAKTLCPEKIVIATGNESQPCVKDFLSVSMEEGIKVIFKSHWTLEDLFESFVECKNAFSADRIIYSFADRPFLDADLTQRLLDLQTKYMAEYAFQDGYPEGFAPEILDGSSCEIMLNLLKQNQSGIEKKEVTSSSIFDVIKNDINAFDIETLLAEKDYRLFRFNFSCSRKNDFIACQRLYQKALDCHEKFSSDELSNLAVKSAEIQKTLPVFYNIQLCACSSSFELYSPYQESFKKKFGYSPEANNLIHENLMTLESFKALVKAISNFSECAVLSFSAFGESLLLPNIEEYIAEVLKNPNLSILIETDGLLLTPALISNIKSLCDAAPERKNGWEKIMWIVKMDAISEEMYNRVHSVNVQLDTRPFEKVFSSVKLLAAEFSEVYPQFVRMKRNESELENFYRYFHDKNSITKGKVLIQKYDSFCKKLDDEKVADLSPLVRNPCWHLKRDMTVLFNGDVPFCREAFFENISGNVLYDSIENIWHKTDSMLQRQVDNCFDGKCGDCDEYYTFNF